MKIGSVTRDMQITIVACNNKPPELNVPDDTCVEAGTYLAFAVSATDPDDDPILLTGTGAPLQVQESPARFDSIYGHGPLYQSFNWQTKW